MDMTMSSSRTGWGLGPGNRDVKVGLGAAAATVSVFWWQHSWHSGSELRGFKLKAEWPQLEVGVEVDGIQPEARDLGSGFRPRTADSEYRFRAGPVQVMPPPTPSQRSPGAVP